MQPPKEFYKAILLLIVISAFSSGLSAQSLVSGNEFQAVLSSSLRGVYIEGVVSDAQKVNVENVTLDFEGKGLPERGEKQLLTGYSISGTDKRNAVRKGSLQVLSAYAWSGGESHTWIASIPSASFLRRIYFAHNGKTVRTQKLELRYGNDDRFKLFRIEAGTVNWRTSFNLVEVHFSKDGGKTWSSAPELRASNGTLPIAKLLDGYQGEAYFLLTAPEKNRIYVELYRAKIE